MKDIVFGLKLAFAIFFTAYRTFIYGCFQFDMVVSFIWPSCGLWVDCFRSVYLWIYVGGMD